MTIDDLVAEEVTIVQVVEAYVRHNPQSRRGPVPLKNWFAGYDIKTGKHAEKSGQGNKYYARWQKTGRKANFDEWVKKQISEELIKKLEQTPYFTQQEFSIDDIVKAYIKHQPRSSAGPVSFKQWFSEYDINTGKHTRKNVQGKKYLHRWDKTGRKAEFTEWIKEQLPEDQKTEFDEWVIKHLPAKLAHRLRQAPYFNQQEFSIEDVVKAYIKHRPETKMGPVPPKHWFIAYDIGTGELKPCHMQGYKYYRKWRRSENTEFEEWLIKQLPQKLAKQLRQMPHFNKQQFSMEDIVKAYIKHQPQSNRGPVPLRSWFERYDVNTGEYTKKGQGRRYSDRWKKANGKFDEWVKEQLPKELAKQLEQTQYYTKQNHSIEDIVKAYIRHNPEGQMGPASLLRWFSKYDINTGELTERGQGSRYHSRWREAGGSIEFCEWVLNQLPQNLAKRLQQMPYFTQQFTIDDIVKAYIKHQPEGKMGPVPLKHWFGKYDINTGKQASGHGQGYKYYRKWRQSDKNTEFEEWINKQIPPELAKQLEQTPYFIQQEFSIEDIVKAYIKNQPKSRMGPVPLKNWFAGYDINTASNTRKGQGRRYYRQWKEQKKLQKTEFDEWIKQQIPPELAKQLEQMPHFTQQCSIEEAVKAYIQYQPKSIHGPVPLKQWFNVYDINTGKRTGKKQGRKYARQWFDHHNKTEFDEWILKQVPEKLQNEYFKQIHGIEQGTDILKALECVMKPRPIQLDMLRSDSVKRMLTAYYIERDLHPEIKRFNPYQTMLYLNTKPEERQQMRA